MSSLTALSRAVRELARPLRGDTGEIAAQNLPHATQRDIRQSTSSAVRQSLWTTSTGLKQNQPTQHQHNTSTSVHPSQWRCGRLAVVVECARSVEAPSTTQCLSEEDLKLANLRNFADIGNAGFRSGSILRRCIQNHVFSACSQSQGQHHSAQVRSRGNVGQRAARRKRWLQWRLDGSNTIQHHSPYQCTTHSCRIRWRRICQCPNRSFMCLELYFVEGELEFDS